jgi:hypothetical protein
MIGDTEICTDEAMRGFVIEVAVMVTLVGLVKPSGAVYVTEVVVRLLKAPKFKGEKVQVAPWLLGSKTFAVTVID